MFLETPRHTRGWTPLLQNTARELQESNPELKFTEDIVNHPYVQVNEKQTFQFLFSNSSRLYNMSGLKCFVWSGKA